MSACVPVGELVGALVFGVAFFVLLAATLSAVAAIEAWWRRS